MGTDIHDDETAAWPGSGEAAAGASRHELPVKGWDHYDAAAFLGEGGMGRVFKAFDRKLKRWVALKFLRGDDPELTRRFLREAELQARVEHPHVAKVYEAGEVDGRPYIAMPFLDGANLRDASREMTLEEKVTTLRHVADGLHAAHRLGLIHRDVKPANVIVERTPEGGFHPYILDFGLARPLEETGLTGTGLTVGTPAYMPPEQALGRSVDVRSDVYALGATLFEVLAGRPPFVGTSALELLNQVVEAEPPPLRRLRPEIPEDLATIVATCLEKEPDRRYDSAHALAEDLGRFLSGDPIAARASSLGYRLRKKAGKHRATVAVAGVALVVSAALVIAFVRSKLDARRQAVLAAELARDVSEIEILLRFAAYTQPAHDVTRERLVVRDRIRRIEERLLAAGPLGTGPGRYALGRAALALDEPRKAREHLEAAWAAGARDANVAEALGQTLLELYQRERPRIGQARSPAAAAAVTKELDETYRQPAERYLESARGAAREAPEHLEAQIAYLRGDTALALERAAAAVGRVPWLWEAHVLSGEIHREAAIAARNAGRFDEARASYTRADTAFRAAIELARSAPAAHRGLCKTLGDRIQLAQDQGGDVDADLESALSACETAALVDPGDPLILLPLSDALWMKGQILGERGVDPRPTLARSASLAERSLIGSLHPAYTLDNIGIAHLIAADWERSHGLDPSGSYEKAFATFERLVAGHPSFGSGHNNFGIGLLGAADEDLARGRDPSPRIARGIEILEKARRLQPDIVDPVVNLADAHRIEARAARAKGRDPGPALDAALAMADEALRRNPTGAAALGAALDVRLLRAETASGAGRDAATELSEAARLVARLRGPATPARMARAEAELARVSAAVRAARPRR